MAVAKVPGDPDNCALKCTSADPEDAAEWLATLGDQYEVRQCPRCRKYHFHLSKPTPPQAH